MNGDDRHSIVVCARCDSISDPQEGSIRAQCAVCEEPVWLSPSVAAHDRARYAEPVCVDCAMCRISGDYKSCTFL